MKIQKIFLKNFRSIGEKGLEISFPVGSTIFIGENNVGKTSIFEAIKLMINLNVMEKIPWDAENWNTSIQTKPIDMVLTIEFNDSEIEKIITIFEPLRISINSFKKLFSNQLIYRILITTPNDRPESFFTFGELTIHNNEGRVGNLNKTPAHYGLTWENIIELGEIESIEKSIRKFFTNAWKSTPTQAGVADSLEISEARISFQKSLPNLLLKFLQEEIITIEEYREKPNKVLNASSVSPTGESLVSILFNLKNGRPREIEKFEKIKYVFHEIFPNLDINVIKEGEEIKILTNKNGVESTTYFLGAGILQILLLVTHLVAHKNKIILIDHPEVHLHPHAERNLSSLIDESVGTQIFLITHSPYFVNIDKQHRILRVSQRNSLAEIHTIPPDYFTVKEYSKFEYLLDISSKELFFARKVLLVEGPTELGAIPVFAKTEKYTFDKNGVSIIDVGGKSNIGLFAKLCEGYHIPYLILADEDAADVLKQVDIPSKSKKFRLNLLSKDFEAILPESLMIEASRIVGKSKPRVGKYVATEMVKRELCVPPEISKLIVKLKELQV